ncbi:MAG: hypothetical protein LUG51_15310 [Tannerellaceae bacterium]|nr:hypothetical protein [Tannerellaceae bacterium]
MPVLLYGCRPADVSGFERHPLLDEVKFWERTTIQVSPDMAVDIEDNSMVLRARTETARWEGSELLTQAMHYGSSVNMASYSYYEDHIMLVGIRNKKFWAGEFDIQDREPVAEWAGDDILRRTLRVSTEEGVEEHEVSSLYGTVFKAGDRKFIKTHYKTSRYKDSGETGFYGMFSLADKAYPLDFFDTAEVHIMDVLPWYGGSTLFALLNNRQVVVKPDQSTALYTGYFPFAHNIPVSSTEYFSFSFPVFDLPVLSFYVLGEERSRFTVTLDQLGINPERKTACEVTLAGEYNGIFVFDMERIYLPEGNLKEILTFKVDKEGNFHR